MKLNLFALEHREVPAAFDLGGGLVSSHGQTFQPFADWTGPLNVTESGNDIYIGAGEGGGPRLEHCDLHGVRLEGDRFVGDPSSREGLVPLIVSPPQNSQDQIGVPLDLSLLGVRLIASQGAPPSSAWDSLRLQLSRLSQSLVQTYIKAGVTLDVVYGLPITNDPMFSDLAGVRVDKYGPSSTTTFDGIGGLTLGQNAVVRLDELGLSGDTALHELGHAIDYMVAHDASQGPDWKLIWKSVKWSEDYFTQNSEEAWAESFARYYAGLPIQPAVKTYFGMTFQEILARFPH